MSIDPVTVSRRRHTATIAVRCVALVMIGLWLLRSGEFIIDRLMSGYFFTPSMVVVLGTHGLLGLLAIVMLAAENPLVNWLVPAALPTSLCPSCGYSLKNLKSPICPECGTNLKPPPDGAA